MGLKSLKMLKSKFWLQPLTVWFTQESDFKSKLKLKYCQELTTKISKHVTDILWLVCIPWHQWKLGTSPRISAMQSWHPGYPGTCDTERLGRSDPWRYTGATGCPWRRQLPVRRSGSLWRIAPAELRTELPLGDICWPNWNIKPKYYNVLCNSSWSSWKLLAYFQK